VVKVGLYCSFILVGLNTSFLSHWLIDSGYTALVLAIRKTESQ